MLGIVDAFDTWVRRDDYEGDLFARALLETRDPENPVRSAAVAGLANMRALIRNLATEAGVQDPGKFAFQIQLLLLGATVAAVSGELDAARRGREVARLMLEQEGIPAES